MTDDESRKAYFAVPDLGSPIPPTPWEIWQAAVEFSTKRERERCAMLSNEYDSLRRDYREICEEYYVLKLHATPQAVNHLMEVISKRQSILGPMGTLKEPKP